MARNTNRNSLMLGAGLGMLIVLGVSCVQAGPYWVAGLTLPPDAKVVSREEIGQVAAADAKLPNGKLAKRELAVTFDTPGDWTAVKAHFDGSLAAAGYSGEHKDDLAALVKQKHPDWDEARIRAAVAKVEQITSKITAVVNSSSAAYEKPGGRYFVSLTDMGGYNQLQSAVDKGLNRAQASHGRYMLLIAEVE